MATWPQATQGSTKPETAPFLRQRRGTKADRRETGQARASRRTGPRAEAATSLSLRSTDQPRRTPPPRCLPFEGRPTIANRTAHAGPKERVRLTCRAEARRAKADV